MHRNSDAETPNERRQKVAMNCNVVAWKLLLNIDWLQLLTILHAALELTENKDRIINSGGNGDFESYKLTIISVISINPEYNFEVNISIG